MKGIIWYANKDIGLEKFEEIIYNYKKLGIDCKVQILATQRCAQFENGDIWKLCSATEASRGEKCNVSLIERKVNRDFVRCVITPSTNNPPFRAYNYYGEADLNDPETYRW